jgi:ATP-dependent Lon protease
MFIATANVSDTIPSPLLDRMEVINFDGYTIEEKIQIARHYLIPRQAQRNGLREGEVEVTDDALRIDINEYTRESGVRSLERELGKIMRKIAKEIVANSDQPSTPGILRALEINETVIRNTLGRQHFFQEAAQRTSTPGVATGLSVTSAGGDVLFIEATSVPAPNTGAPNLVLTGQLGDVMKESAQIALTWVQRHSKELGIDQKVFKDQLFHLHVPAGAIPKDGPSAGVTMACAFASLLSGRPVRSNVGMTGELTLQGRVLPIGGLKQKALAANAASLTDVIYPERNEGDLKEIPAEVLKSIRFHPVSRLDQVLELALEERPQAEEA